MSKKTFFQIKHRCSPLPNTPAIRHGFQPSMATALRLRLAAVKLRRSAGSAGTSSPFMR